MNETFSSADSTERYVLGHSGREIERLQVQARLIGPITKRIFQEAGIVPGMRVLDVGSGAGDLAFLVADLVGEAGEVIGVDRVPTATDAACTRAIAARAYNVHFRTGDPTQMTFDHPFDAVVGRYVLQFQKQPASMLRSLAGLVRSGGLVAFHEIDWNGLTSFPPIPTFDRCCRWGLETLRLHGTETRMGSKLHSTFVQAGLSAPSIRLEALIGGGLKGADVLRLMTDLTATLLSEMERLGVASAAEVGVETLFDRMQQEAVAATSLVVGHYQIGAWSRT